MNLSISTFLLASTLVFTASCGKLPPNAQAVTPGTSPSPSPTLSSRADTTSAPMSSPARDSNQPLEIPSGTRVSVRLQSPISSANAQSGDRFRAVLDSPLGIHGQTVAPAGANVSGRVVAAEHSGRLEHPGMLQLELSSVQVGGKEVAIHTSRITARGASHKTRNLSWIGGGAGGGALLGGLMGGGKGALIGSVAGAGAGTATAAATGKHDVAFNVEHPLTFELRQQVEIR